VQFEKYVVAVEIEVVIPDEDPSEPCLEPEVVEFLKQVKLHADQGDFDSLIEPVGLRDDVDQSSNT
jgi:hypothetical protein